MGLARVGRSKRLAGRRRLLNPPMNQIRQFRRRHLCLRHMRSLRFSPIWKAALTLICVIFSLVTRSLSQAVEPTPKDSNSLLITLHDVAQDYSRGRTLELQASGDLDVRTFDKDKERLHRIKLPPDQVRALLAFIPTSGIYEYRALERAGGPDEIQQKITLTLPKQKRLVVQKWANDRSPQFDKLYERLSLLVGHAVKNRAEILSQQADSIRTARKIVAEEFAGYYRTQQRTLNTAPMVDAELEDLANILNGPELAEEPADVEIAGCFDPHHAFIVTESGWKIVPDFSVSWLQQNRILRTARRLLLVHRSGRGQVAHSVSTPETPDSDGRRLRQARLR